MTAEHHRPREPGREPHHGQRDPGEEDSIVDRHGLKVENSRRGGHDGIPQPPPDAATDRRCEGLGHRQRRGGEPGRFGQRERGGQGILGGVEGRLGPGQAAGPGQSAGGRIPGLRHGPFSDFVTRRNQHRAQITGFSAEQAGEPDGHGEEPGEAQCLVPAERLQMPPQALRAGVDAADHLGVRGLGLAGGCLGRQ